MGGLGLGEVERGITTTARRRSLTMFVERTRHGLVLAISEPNVGSSRTHQISPRLGIVPGLGDVRGNQVEVFLYLQNIFVPVGLVASAGK